MSIAVSAVIVPSRRLRWLLAAWCACLCAAAACVAWQWPARHAWAGVVAFAPLFAGLAAGGACVFYPAAATARRIDISGVGQVRLTVQQGMESPTLTMTLLPGATVWPGCMVLRLRDEGGTARPLLLLPDSVAPGAYRALAVAVRALSGGAGHAAAVASGPGALPPQIL